MTLFIARDKDGSLYCGDHKPIRGNKGMWLWNQDKQSILMEGFPFNEIPSFIDRLEWKDSPIQIGFDIKKK